MFIKKDCKIDEQGLTDAVVALKLLANDRRLAILCLIGDGEMSVTEIGDYVDLSQSALSQHLALFRKSGIVETRKHGQVVYYALKDEKIKATIAKLYQLYCQNEK